MTFTTTQLTCSYIDICCPDDLNDHHWREGETLLAGCIWEGMTIDELVTELWDSLNSSANDIFSKFSEDEIKEAIRYEFDDCISRDFGLTLRCFGIEPDADLEKILLYAYLSW